jgi:membrane associated rhomboid family serine protease
VFVSIKPLHVSVLFHDHLQGVLRCALCRYSSSRWFAFVESVLLHSMWPHVCVICVYLVFLGVGDLLVKLCFVPLLFLPLICVRWVCIITQYVATCVCHLCVFGVLVCWWSHKQITSRQENQTRFRVLAKYVVKICRVEWLDFDGANGASGFENPDISKAVTAEILST